MPQTILYVEGDENLRRVVGRALVRRGHRVLVAANAAEALALAAHASVVDLLVVELQLFGMSGVALAHQLETLRSLAVLITADDAAVLAECGYDHVRYRCLFKPFSLAEFGEAVDSALGAPVPDGRRFEEPVISLWAGRI